MSLLSFLGRTRAESHHDPAPRAGPAGYRTVDPGIAAATVEQLLSSHAELLSRIKLCYGADRSTFEADLLVPIRNVAGFVNVLPATADNFHCEAGGLFRLGLEVAFFALQGTDGHIVSGRSTISTRRHLEPRWRQATFLAGLCTELHRTLGNVVVTDDRGDEWPAYLSPLTGWLQRRRSKRFFLRWLPGTRETRALGIFVLRHIVPEQTLQHLATGNTFVVPQLLACVAGVPLYGEQSILIDLVKRATALVIDRDLIAVANRHGRPLAGAHVARYLVDAMRRLVASHPAWVPNQERSRVWYGKDGLFIVWPNAATEIRKLLEEDELPGMPKAAETIVDVLLAAGVLEGRAAAQPLWSIAPPPGRMDLEAVKVSSPEIVLPNRHEIGPLSIAIASGVQQDRQASAAPPSASAAGNSAEPRASKPLPEDGERDRASAEPAVAHRDNDATDASDESSTPSAPVDDQAPAPAVEPLPVYKLDAPLRLDRRVRDALAAAIDTLNGDARLAAAVTVPTGVFVPLAHFKRAGIDLPTILRALAEARMTASRDPAGVETVCHEIDGNAEPGIVLKPEFVKGLDPGDFARVAPGG